MNNYSSYDPYYNKGDSATFETYKQSLEKLANISHNKQTYRVSGEHLEVGNKRIWKILDALATFFGFEKKADPIKVDYQLIKMLSYGERHHYMESSDIRACLTVIKDNLHDVGMKGFLQQLIDSYSDGNCQPGEIKNIAQKQVESFYQSHQSHLVHGFWMSLFRPNVGSSSIKRTAYQGYSIEKLQKLREVKESDYKESLVDKFIKKADISAKVKQLPIAGGFRNTKQLAKAQELAVYQAYNSEEFNTFIKGSIVDPASIYTDMVRALKVDDKTLIRITSREHLLHEIESELIDLTKIQITDSHGHKHKHSPLTLEETRQILEEAKKFSKLFSDAYPHKSLQDNFHLTRDCCRAIVYQVLRDRGVFCGSDHGVRHILESIKMDDKILNGISGVTTKDRFLCHLTTILHDIGYTVDAAQASFAASKDHPLFGAKFIEINRKYFEDYIGADETKALSEAILYHSYPRNEFFAAPGVSFHPKLIRSVTASVDALGATADNKMPTLWRNPRALKVLQQIKMRGDIDPDYDPFKNEKPSWLKQYRQKLEIIVKEDYKDHPELQEGFKQAISHHLTTLTSRSIFQQYAGVVSGIKMIKNPKDTTKYIPEITLGISQNAALLANLFGNPTALGAFKKLMEDFGIEDVAKKMDEFGQTISKLQEIEKQIKQTKNSKERTKLRQDYDNLKKTLTFATGNAVFVVKPKITEPTPEIVKSFETYHSISIRPQIKACLDWLKMQPPEKMFSSQDVEEMISRFFSTIDDKDREEIRRSLATSDSIPLDFLIFKFSEFATSRELAFTEPPDL